jgi:hypothetical protein
MQHPDEGTIHAYLDGALSAAEARDVETHVASCEACQAGVAAARGLIAASSRIVSHLDAVPRGVIPAKAPSKSRWIFSAWPTAIAATLVIGIGLVSIRGKEEPVLPLTPAPTPGVIRSTAPESMPVVRPRRTVEPSPQRQVVPQRAADRTASKSVANEATPPTVQLPPANVAAQKSAVAPPPPSPAPRPDSNKRSGLALEAIVVTSAPPSSRSSAKVGNVAAGMAAGAAAPPAAAVADSRMASEQPTPADAKAFVGCYEAVEAPARGFAAERYERFALVDEPAPTSGQLAIRTLDPAGRPAAVIFGAGWSVQGERATVRDSKGRVVLTLIKTDSGVRSPAVRVISCK